MDDEIDLRPYAMQLVRHYRLILAVAALTALAAGAVSFILPPVYEATAYVYVLTDAARNIGGVSSGAQVLSQQTQLSILQSTPVLETALKSLAEPLTDEESRGVLRGDTVRVTVDGVDKSLFRVTAQSHTARKAPDLAGAVAAAGAGEINRQNGMALAEVVLPLQTAVDAASKEYQATAEALSQRRQALQIDAVTLELTRTERLLTSQSDERASVQLALAQTGTLKQQLAQGQISLSPEMLLNLQPIATAAGTSFLIQPSQMISLTRQQQTDQLDAILAALTARQQALSVSVDTLVARLAVLHQQLADKQNALIDPERQRDLARSNYGRAAELLRDARARQTVMREPARVTSGVAPLDPVSPKKGLNTAVGAIAGLIGSVLVVLAAYAVRSAHAGDASAATPPSEERS